MEGCDIYVEEHLRNLVEAITGREIFELQRTGPE